MERTAINGKGKAWLKKETAPYRPSILFLCCLAVFSSVFSIAFAYTVQYLINSASNGANDKMWLFAGLILAFILLKILLKTVENYFAEKLRAKMTAQLRIKSFSKILRSEYADLQSYHSGDLLTRLTSDIQEVVSYTVGLPLVICGTSVQFLGAIVALLTLDPIFTGIYLLAGCVFVSITAFFRKYLKRSHKEVLETDGDLRAFMQEGLGSVMTVKAYGAENKSAEKAQKLADVYYRKRIQRNRLRVTMNGLFSLLSNFGLIFAVVWCAISVLNGSTDYGLILSSILLLMQLQGPLTSFSSIPPAYYARIASGERMEELENIPLEKISISEDLRGLYRNLQSIVIQDLSFTYGRDDIFKNASTEIKKGEIVCLTGPSGAGKSTIFKLLLNVFPTTEGDLALHTVDSTISLTAKERGLFAYVPQGNFLFSGTIRENLLFFMNEESTEDVDKQLENALKTACADFVFELPDGLNTVLSERGEGLSEGQLQRLAVARALLSNRPILLLDEATSALDSDTEERLVRNIRALQDKTCLIVTHRPAALAIADKVLRIENGKITNI